MDDPSYILWEYGTVSSFANEWEAHDEWNAMNGRGVHGRITDELDEAVEFAARRVGLTTHSRATDPSTDHEACEFRFVCGDGAHIPQALTNLITGGGGILLRVDIPDESDEDGNRAKAPTFTFRAFREHGDTMIRSTSDPSTHIDFDNWIRKHVSALTGSNDDPMIDAWRDDVAAGNTLLGFEEWQQKKNQ